MPTAEDQTPLRDLLSRRWPEIEDAARTIVVGSGETIRPDAPGGTDSAHGRAIAALLAHSRLSSDGARIHTRDVLGMGGMGIVHEGTQTSLDRSVAVKSVRPDKKTPSTTLKLLQEAWIAGRLEHPNIVPVYDIGADASGEPLIVQQRVAGTSWDDLCGEADVVHERFGASDLLEFNIRVLMQVCNAVHFAHSRRIVHLDIKPSNVMIGAFGEVLILDWGLAMSLDDDGTGRLPLAKDNDEIVGTPSYLAPEMLAQEGDRLDERTDVYLLGATLYELCCGHPPHRGSGMIAILYKIATEPAPSPDGAPPELAAMCARAMAMDPAERFSSAEELRLALQDFLEHRSSARLAEEAAAQVVLLEAAVEGGSEETLRGMFSAARFGFEQALHSWPENPEARAGLRDLLIKRCSYALQLGNAVHAAELLAGVEDPPAELKGNIAEALEQLEGDAARLADLQEFRDDMDVRIGQRTRVFIVGLLGVMWTLVPLARHFGAAADLHETYKSAILVPTAFLGLLGLLLVWARDSMTRTTINRRTSWTVGSMLCFQIVLTTLAWDMGLSEHHLMTLNFLLWSVCAVMFSIGVDRRTLPMAAGFVAALAASVRWPEGVWLLTAAANFGLVINAVLIWFPRPFLPPKGVARDR